MSWIEILGFVTGALSVAFAVRESAWNWPVGIANNVFFLILFWKAKLYADALLQIVYAVISIYGWWNWVRGGAGNSKLPITHTGLKASVWLFIGTIVSTAILFHVLDTWTDSKVPLADGVTTALSLTAQFMLSKKLLENWWVWMTADVIYILLYCYKGLYLTGILYAIFFVMCIVGYWTWRKTFQASAHRPEAFQ